VVRCNAVQYSVVQCRPSTKCIPCLAKQTSCPPSSLQPPQPPSFPSLPSPPDLVKDDCFVAGEGSSALACRSDADRTEPQWRLGVCHGLATLASHAHPVARHRQRAISPVGKQSGKQASGEQASGRQASEAAGQTGTSTAPALAFQVFQQHPRCGKHDASAGGEVRALPNSVPNLQQKRTSQRGGQVSGRAGKQVDARAGK